MQKVRSGELPWLKIDALHRLILDDLLDEYGLRGLAESDIEHLNRVWHRLDPWPDAVPGLTRLKARYVVTTLSNGNFSLLTNMAKRAGLPWDCIVSAELFRHYKPDPETYLGTAELLGIAAADLMLVACHPDDLRAARAAGCRTGYVERPLELGPGHRRPAWRTASSMSSRAISSSSRSGWAHSVTAFVALATWIRPSPARRTPFPDPPEHRCCRSKTCTFTSSRRAASYARWRA